jgi:anion-transporting  ArsA/GET3 family ATPase
MAHSTSLDERRFLFVTGKGGVGKTTVCAGMALAMAARGKRVLVAMTGPHERLSAILGTPPIGHDIREVSRGVWATRIDPARAMEEYGEMVIRVRAIARAVFDNKYTSTFFRAVPGLHDWSLLGKAWFHTTETDRLGNHRFDVVIFDAPSTGHGLEMLRVPKVILEIVPPGVLRRDAEEAWDLFQDPARSGVVVVSLPEDMPTTESIELITALRDDLALPLAGLIVNGVLEPLFSPAERKILTAEEDLLEVGAHFDDPGEEALSVAAKRALRESLQAGAIARLEEAVGVRAVRLPYLLEGANTPDGARRIAAKL